MESKGYRASNEKEARAVIEEAFSIPEPVLIDFRVVQKENVYPMVVPGTGLHEMIGVGE